MATIRVPAEALGSPQDSTVVRYDSETDRFSDDHGNTWTPDELAACRPGNHIKKWLRENFPREKR